MELLGTSPILCAPLIREVDERLVELLRSLDDEEWDLSTIAPLWRVRDVAAHLLDTALRKLSRGRDGYRPDNVVLHSPQDVVALVNRLNSEGVAMYSRLSPRVLADLMELICGQTADFYESLDPFSTAIYGVSWAGEMTSLMWFDTARELTERWHHQEQIRLATNRPGIAVPHLYRPVLDTFLRGLPHAYRDVEAEAGTALVVHISGDCGGYWCLSKWSDGWRFLEAVPSSIATEVVLPQTIAWRLFTKGINRDQARAQARVAGDAALAEPVFQFTAIVG